MPKYSPFQRFGHRLISSRLVSKFTARTMHHLDRLFFRVTRNRTSLSALIARLPVINMTSVGAKSGLPRTSPLLGIVDETNSGHYAIIASNWGQKHYPGWYYNVKANPKVRCTIRGKTGDYLATEITGAEYERFWGYAGKTYVGYPKYKERTEGRPIPIFLLTSLEPAAEAEKQP